MPASARSLRLTDAYRDRLLATRERLEAQVERSWPTIETLDGTDWPERMAAAVAQSQTEAVRVSAAYLGAFITTETGRRARAPTIDPREFAGKSRDGRPLVESLRSPLIGTYAALNRAYAVRPQMMDVTPAMAKAWLSGGSHGNLKQADVEDLAARMRDGTWDSERGQIMVASNGFVFDGQHRLEAVIESDLTVPMRVARGFEEPLSTGLNRARRTVEVDYMNAARESLRVAMDAHPEVQGWQRAVRGTCGACTGDIATEVRVETASKPLGVHPNCQCVTQPVVVGAAILVPMLSGQERLDAMTPAEQDEQFGPEKAEALRDGTISLADLVDHSELATAQDFITEKPLNAAL